MANIAVLQVIVPVLLSISSSKPTGKSSNRFLETHNFDIPFSTVTPRSKTVVAEKTQGDADDSNTYPQRFPRLMFQAPPGYTGLLKHDPVNRLLPKEENQQLRSDADLEETSLPSPSDDNLYHSASEHGGYLSAQKRIIHQKVFVLNDQPRVCVFKNKTYNAGETFNANKCTSCRCPPDGGTPRCFVTECRLEPNCLEYNRSEGQCCGNCVDYGCKHSDGRIYVRGAKMPSRTKCEECFCHEEGHMVCESKISTLCPRLRCVDPVLDEDGCCPRCPRGPNCYLGNQIISGDVVIQVDKCISCSCPREKKDHLKFHTTQTAENFQQNAICRYKQCKPCSKNKVAKMVLDSCCPICAHPNDV